MENEQRWQLNYEQLVAFLEENKHCPSKYHAEERDMYNWLKHNKKLSRQGKMPEVRQERFQKLVDMAVKLRRVNQYAYASPSEKQMLLDL